MIGLITGINEYKLTASTIYVNYPDRNGYKLKHLKTSDKAQTISLKSTFEFDSETDGEADGHPYELGQKLCFCFKFSDDLYFIFFSAIVKVCHGKVRYLSIDLIFNEMACSVILKSLCLIE